MTMADHQTTSATKVETLSRFARWTVQICNNKLAKADIQMGGDRDTDMIIYRKRLARRLVKYGLGFDKCFLGESYMAGDCLIFIIISENAIPMNTTTVHCCYQFNFPNHSTEKLVPLPHVLYDPRTSVCVSGDLSGIRFVQSQNRGY